MTTTVAVNTCATSRHCRDSVCAVRTFEIRSLDSVQVYNRVLASCCPGLYTRSWNCLVLELEVSVTNVSPRPQFLATANLLSPMSSASFTFHI